METLRELFKPHLKLPKARITCFLMLVLAVFGQRPDGARRQHAIGKEPPLKRLRFGRGCRVTGEPDQRDGALAENCKDQHQKAGHACFGTGCLFCSQAMAYTSSHHLLRHL